jgi:hypothetical protein
VFLQVGRAIVPHWARAAHLTRRAADDRAPSW